VYTDEFERLYCKRHSKQTLDRQLHGDLLNAANEHLKAALFNRHSEAGCHESINAALRFLMAQLSLERRQLTPRNIINSERVVSHETGLGEL
jgi:hypothetical protein